MSTKPSALDEIRENRRMETESARSTVAPSQVTSREPSNPQSMGSGMNVGPSRALPYGTEPEHICVTHPVYHNSNMLSQNGASQKRIGNMRFMAHPHQTVSDDDDDDRFIQHLLANQLPTRHEITIDVSKLMATNEQLNRIVKKLKDKIEKLNLEISQLNKANKVSIDEEVSKLKRLNTDTEQRLQMLHQQHQRQLEEIENRASDLAGKNSELTDQVARLTQENNDLKDEVEKLSREKHLLEQEVARLKGRIIQLEDAVIESKQEFDQFKERIEAESAKKEVEFAQYKSEKETQFVQLNNEFTTFKKEKEIEDNARDNVLIMGEIAFKFDKTAVKYIFAERFRDPDTQKKKLWEESASHLTFKRVINNEVDPPMTQGEKENLESFLDVCKSHKCTWGKYTLAHLLSDFKGINREDYAHLKTKRKSLTREDIRKIIEHGNHKDKDKCKKLYDILCECCGEEYLLAD